MAPRAFITGLSGLTISASERAFLKDARPWGLIIFQRNVKTPQQVTELTHSFRDSVGRDAPVLVDQEGGRVQRLGPPHWPKYPSGAAYGALFDREKAVGLAAARLGGHLIAADLGILGIDVDCLPLADVPAPGARPGDRRPRLWNRARQGRRHRRRDRAGPAGRRCLAGAQASAGAWPRQRRQPSSGSRWSRPTGPPWKRPILPPFGRLPGCRWA